MSSKSTISSGARAPCSRTRQIGRQLVGVRVIAVDWSGALLNAQQKIWLAEVVDGQLVRLENGRDRPALTIHLIEQAKADPQVVVGLDFAFSLPAWYLKLRGLASAQD